MYLWFLGAAGTVTGSRYLVETDNGTRILIDCGLFQGLKQLRERNWKSIPVPPDTIDAVLLTHAHLDHTGYLPALVRDGLRAPIYATGPTFDLAQIMLPDSGYLQEEDAAFANRHRLTRHDPALPLYTRIDAERAAARIQPVAFEVDLPLPGGVRARFRRSGHILGAASILLHADGRDIVFSGDIGTYDAPLTPAPRAIEHADVLVMESTYGGRSHPQVDPADELAGIVRTTAARGGVIVVPAFAVGRAQTLMFLLGRLRAAGEIPPIPVFLDSPMAQDVTALFARHGQELRVSPDEWRGAIADISITNSVADSKAIDARNGPFVVISASGMATGGRVIHHLKVFAPHHRNTVLFAGFQAAGTRGQAMVNGAETIRIHGLDVPVRAEVRTLDSLSAHADHGDLIRWAGALQRPPRHVFLTHGEPIAADLLRRGLKDSLGWEAHVAEHLQKVTL